MSSVRTALPLIRWVSGNLCLKEPGNTEELRPFEGNADIILSLGDRAQVRKSKADWTWKAEIRDMIGSRDIRKDFISSGRLTVFPFFMAGGLRSLFGIEGVRERKG